MMQNIDKSRRNDGLQNCNRPYDIGNTTASISYDSRVCCIKSQQRYLHCASLGLEGAESIVRVKDAFARDSWICAGDDDSAPSGGCGSLNHLLYERRRLVGCCEFAIVLPLFNDEGMRSGIRNNSCTPVARQHFRDWEGVHLVGTGL